MADYYVGDPYVYNTQKWLNETYGSYIASGRFNTIEQNGKIGWATIYGLIRALQIELGIQNTANNFGTGTINAFKSKYPNGIKQQDDDDTSESNVYGIIQGALLCKGYAIGANKPTLHFYSGTGNAIKKLKKDAGIDSSSSVVTLNIMKALLSMDYFVSYSSSTKTKNIQIIQRYLNANYEDYIGLTPCDGTYNRGTNKALIYAIQAEEGLPTTVANGNFGNTTKKCCPTIPYNNQEKDYSGKAYSSDKINKFIVLLKMGLYVNGIGDGDFSNTLNTAYLKHFQSKYSLDITGKCNLTTWLSIFISSGDTSRTAKACDCATILTLEKAKTLYNNGYRYVGRYLTGTISGGISKALTKEEADIAFECGLRIFPIYQTSANKVSYFSESQGTVDAINAFQAARKLGISAGTIIYFAVDCDPQDGEITSNIIPYFKSVFETMRDNNDNVYKIGVYGTRNVCTRVSNLKYASTSFVSDMSTGFSGNLGFSIPNNWAFDQFATVTVGSGDGLIEIDKDGYSGLDSGIGSLDLNSEIPVIDDEHDYSIRIGNDSTNPEPTACINLSSIPYNVYSLKTEGIENSPAKEEFEKACELLKILVNSPSSCNLWGVAGRKIGEIKPGDLFIRFSCNSPDYEGTPLNSLNRNEGDGVHKVLFRDVDGALRFGYIQEVLGGDDFNVHDSHLAGRYRFDYCLFDAEKNEVELKTQDEKVNNIYIVQRELQYRDTEHLLGTLPIGTKLKNGGKTGETYYDWMWFQYIYNEETKTWDLFEKHVHLDMENGVNGYELSLWKG